MDYLLVGDGRLAASLAAYMKARAADTGAKLVRWSRRSAAAGVAEPLETLAAEADAVLLAVSDDALPALAARCAGAARGPIIHFSGARRIDRAHAMHPLAAFTPRPFTVEDMEAVVFVCDSDGPGFADVFPGWPNPHVRLDPSERPLYHALAVLSGNLVSYVWNRTAEIFRDRLTPDLPAETVLAPYFRSLLGNFEASPTDSLTGPVRRRDAGTVAANLAALEGQPELLTLYRAFLDAAWPDYRPPEE